MVPMYTGRRNGEAGGLQNGRGLRTQISHLYRKCSYPEVFPGQTRGEMQAPERSEELSPWQFWCSGFCTPWRF